MLGENGSFQREVVCNQDDSAIVVYYQCPDISPKNIALYSLANHLMSATFFHEIRTKAAARLYGRHGQYATQPPPATLCCTCNRRMQLRQTCWPL